MSACSPLFLTVELTLQVHREMILAYGGSDGVRDLGLIESAVAQGQNIYNYANGDLFAIAAAYAFHLAENQAFIDATNGREPQPHSLSSNSTTSIFRKWIRMTCTK